MRERVHVNRTMKDLVADLRFKKRYRRIITKYEDENSVQRKAGVWALTVYIVATFICFFIEALHRQGKI